MRKLKAFTFIEVVLVILLSSIVVGSVFSILTLSKKMYVGHMLKENNMSLFYLLHDIMESDWYTARSIKEENMGFIVVSSSNKQIKYELNKQYVVRSYEENTDTFSIECIDYDLISLIRGDLIYSYLNIQFKLDSDTVPLLIFNNGYKKKGYVNFKQ